MIDVIREIQAARRQVEPGRTPGEPHTVRLRRTYDAPIEEVWDALTNPERISRWFLPISGDFRVGGSYQTEGNAGGEILACERPNRVRVSWIFGEPDPNGISEVELRLTPEGPDATTLELEHVATVPDEMWDQFGPGAVGVGWEQGALGLALYLRTGSTVGDPIAWQLSGEGIDFATRSSEGWGAASRAAGVDDDTVARNVAATTAFYTIDPNAAGGGEGEGERV
jgi:uncharacterized protein YndB with AHSA1/START domain